jgi:hypothetical protein
MDNNYEENTKTKKFYLPAIRKAMYFSKTSEKFKMLCDYLESIVKEGQAIYMTSVFDIGDIMYGYKLGVNGDDIMEAFDLKPGPIVKKVLDKVLEQAFVSPKIYMKKENCLMLAEGILYDKIKS